MNRCNKCGQELTTGGALAHNCPNKMKQPDTDKMEWLRDFAT